MQLFFKTLVTCLLFLLCCFASHVIAGSDWELKKDKDGIKVYMRSIPGTEIKELRATFLLNTTLNSMMLLLEDVAGYKDWIYRCHDVYEISKPDTNEICYYQQSSVPWPVKNRDLIVHSHWRQDESNKIIYINGKGLPDYIPAKNGVVRIRNFTNSWKLTPFKNGFIQVDYQIKVDPGGLLPTWLINMVAAEGQHQTCVNLAKAIKNPKYHVRKDMVKEF